MFKLLKRKKFRRLLALAILLRLLIMPFFFHPDIKTYHFQSSFLREGVFNIYSYLVANKANLPLKEEFVYFPLAYFLLGGYQLIVSPLLGNNFGTWVSDASGQFTEMVGTYRYLFLLKLPYLVIDLLIAFLLMEFFADEKKKQWVFGIWLFNPITPIIIYIFSNLDIIPVILTLWSLLLFRRNRKILAAGILGLAAGFKLYPLLLLPFAFQEGKTFKEKIGIIVIPFLILLGITIPFWSTGFVNSAFVSGLSTRMFAPGISLQFGERIIPAVVLLAGLFFSSLTTVKKKNLLLYIVFVFLITFSFIHFHIQWLLWVAPFLVILIAENKKQLVLICLISLLAFVLPFLYEDKSMTVSLFRVYSQLFEWIPIPFAIVNRLYDAYSVQSILHSGLAGGTLLLVWRLLGKTET